MDGHPELNVRWEWESAPLVRAPEHQATWARLEIWVGPDCVTLVEDRESQSSRHAIYCPLYPLAEWIAYNWWFLRADARPTPQLTRMGQRVIESKTGPRGSLNRHRLQSAGDGFSWPKLLLVPEGQSTRAAWTSRAVPESGRGTA
jgi:hypothetical protein